MHKEYFELGDETDLTRAAAFAIRLVAISILIWAIRWW